MKFYIHTYGCQMNVRDSEAVESLMIAAGIHRVDFGEVSGHRVLLKRGPGNRGASQRGSTLEATSGMSS